MHGQKKDRIFEYWKERNNNLKNNDMKNLTFSKIKQIKKAMPIYVVLKNDSSKLLRDMDIIAMSYDFMDLQGVDGVLTVIH